MKILNLLPESNSTLMRPYTLTFLIFSFVFTSFLAVSCSEKTETFESEAVGDYMPLQPGKYITYRTDSLVFPNFGRLVETHRYQEKHLIDAQVTDNLGRPSFRVFRYLRDSAGLNPWVPAGSYYITPLADQVETIEDNFRQIKLHMPMNDGFSWHGNQHLFLDPYEPLFSFSNDDNIQTWDYTYEDFEPTFSYRNQNYTDVWTIMSIDESHNLPVIDVNQYSSRTGNVEKYAKNIGMVFRQLEMWEHQPNTGGTGGPFKSGFAVTMWMIDHN